MVALYAIVLRDGARGPDKDRSAIQTTLTRKASSTALTSRTSRADHAAHINNRAIR